MSLTQTLALLRSTRRLTVAVAVLLSIQMFGNLYEELVTNVAAYADPQPGSVGALEPGSPLFFYLPWVPIGVVLSVVLVVRLHRAAPPSVARAGRGALLALGVAIGAKAFLISQVNPEFRRADISVDEIRSTALLWGMVNGVAIAAVAIAAIFLLAWRPRLLEVAARREDQQGLSADI